MARKQRRKTNTSNERPRFPGQKDPALSAASEKSFIHFEGYGIKIILGSSFAWVLIAFIDLFSGRCGITSAFKNLTAEIKTAAEFIMHLHL